MQGMWERGYGNVYSWLLRALDYKSCDGAKDEIGINGVGPTVEENVVSLLAYSQGRR